MSDTDQPTEEDMLLDQLKGNWQISTLLPMAYFKANNLSIDDYVKYCGESLSKGWIGIKGKGAKAMLDAVTFNVRSFRAEVINQEGDESSATAIYGPYMPKEVLDYIGVTAEELDKLNDVFIPIAESLDLSLTWEKKGENSIVKISK